MSVAFSTNILDVGLAPSSGYSSCTNKRPNMTSVVVVGNGEQASEAQQTCMDAASPVSRLMGAGPSVEMYSACPARPPLSLLSWAWCDDRRNMVAACSEVTHVS